MLKRVLSDMWANVKNEIIFFYFQSLDLVPYYAISVLKKLNQSDHMDCKIIILEREGVFLVGSLDLCHIIKIQSPRSHEKTDI